MKITQRLTKFLRCTLAVLIVGSAVLVLPVAMQTPQRANAAVITGFTQVDGSQGFACALKSDGTVWCWGINDYGMLGNGDGNRNRQSSPVQVSGLTDVTQISTGFRTSCAVKSDGTVWCWGAGGQGELGNQRNDLYKITPQQVYNLTGVTQVSSGFRHVCAVKTDGTVFCWGQNFSRQLGTASSSDTNYPVAAAGITTATEVRATYENTCVRLQDQTVRCWGGSIGLGNGSSVASATAVQPTGLSGVSTLSPTDGSTICAAKTNQTLWCWGNNSSGQIGNGNTTNQLTPVQVSSITGVTGVSGSIDTHTCARKSDGTAMCWGYNGSKQVGDGTSVQRLTPTAVTGLTGVSQISAGEYFSCAVLQDTTIKCWGGNGEGTLGDGSNVDRATPAYVRTTPTVLSTPASVAATATASTAKSIDVSWGAVSNSTSYTVQMYDSSGATLLGTRENVTTTSTSLTSATYASIADNTTYKVTVTAVGDGGDYANSSASAQVSVTTNSVAATPSITSQPVALNRTSGQSGTFSVTATRSDAGTLSYQWLKDGANISGATSSSYTINPVSTADAGSFAVRVTNSLSGKAPVSTTSSAASLTVAGALSIATPATGLTGTANSAFSLAVPGAGGRTTFTYALIGTLISGLSLATSTGTISGTPTVAGSSTVSVRVTDANGATAITSNFTISIDYASTTVSLALTSASPQYRVSNTITATTSRAGTVNFKLDGTSISGCESVAAATTTATCAWVPSALGIAALSAVFTPTTSSTYSNSTASLSPTVAAQAITVTPTANQSKVFASSDPIFTYSITTGSLYGLDTLTGALSRAAGEDVGTYQIAIGTLSNANYAITLAPVNFMIRGAGVPTISTSPASASKTSGQSLTLTATAVSPDTGTLSFQWFKDGAAIVSATLTTYTINSLTTSDTGSYTVVVTNSISNGVSTSTATATSSAATLTVSGPVSISTPSSGLSGSVDAAFSLSVAGSGGRAALSYSLTGTLVSGLSLSTSTGAITGTPTLAGTSTVSVTVTDANGATATTSNFTLSIGYASTTVSLALASSSPQYRISNTITATASRAGTVNFKLNGTSITGCESVAASITTATCAWVPVDLGAANLTATFSPTESSAYANSDASLGATVVGRAITVTPTAGQSKVFGNSEPVMSYSITSGSLFGLDTLSGALSRAVGEEVGAYQIELGTLSNANYAITLAPVNFAITQATQASVSLTTFTGVYATGLTLSASGGSGSGLYSFAVISAGTAGCSIIGGVLNATATGTCTVAATRAASTNYLIASSGATTVTIVKATQAVLSLTSISGTFNTNISLTASGGTGTGGHSYSVSDVGTAGCSILSGTSLTSSSAGTCNVIVTKAGDSNYESRSSVATLVTFAKDSQNALTLRDSSGDLDSGITLSVTGGSGVGAISYSVTSGSASCSIASGVVNARFVGSCTLTSTKASDANYLQKQITNTLTFIKATQSAIQVTSVSGTYGTPIQLTITGGSGSGSLSYAVSDTGSASCVVNGTQLTFSSAGSCKVTATRDADSVFDARSSVSTTITIDRSNQTPLSVATSTGDLLTGIIVAVTGGGGTGSVSTSVTSGTANCTLTAGVVTARNFGTCSLSISKAGDTNFFSASGTVTLTFAKALPSLGTVSSPLSSALGTGITLAYTGGTGNGAVTYTLVSPGTAGCSITNGVLNATSGGKCTVTVTKQGDDTYADQVVTTEFTFVDDSVPSTTTTIARAASTGVATPKATSTTSTTLVPTTTVAPKKQALPPSLVNTPSAVGAATIGGKTTKAKTTRVNNQLVFTAGGFTVTLAGVNADGTIIPLSSDGLLEVKRGDMFRLDAQGFAPNSSVDIWMFSKTFLMDTIEVGADGLVKSTLKVPKSVEDGLHHLVMVGVDKAKKEAKFEVGMNVGVPPKQWWYSRILIAIPISIAVFIGFWLPTSASRRRRRIV
jgi:alpha-tubulin suppressor-like RCC1 family protein